MKVRKQAALLQFSDELLRDSAFAGMRDRTWTRLLSRYDVGALAIPEDPVTAWYYYDDQSQRRLPPALLPEDATPAVTSSESGEVGLDWL